MKRQNHFIRSGDNSFVDPTTESEASVGHGPRALVIGLKLLEYLSNCRSPMTAAALAEAVSVPASSVRRSLLVLEQRGYVMRTDKDGSYARTGGLFLIRSTPLPHQRLLRMAKPIMRALADEISQSCNLSIPCSPDMQVIAQEESSGPFGINIPIGFRYDIPASAAGLVFVSFMNNSDSREWPDRGSRVGGSDVWASLRRAVQNTTETGFAQMTNPHLPDLTDLSCPIFEGQHLIAALTVPYIKTVRGPNLAWCLAALQHAAEALNESLPGDALVA